MGAGVCISLEPRKDSCPWGPQHPAAAEGLPVRETWCAHLGQWGAPSGRSSLEWRQVDKVELMGKPSKRQLGRESKPRPPSQCLELGYWALKHHVYVLLLKI